MYLCTTAYSLYFISIPHAQVLMSPPGTTLSVYIISGYGLYTEVSFWNGNSTSESDIISVRQPSNTYGSLISSSTNAMTIKVSRQYSWNSMSVDMLITVQNGRYLLIYHTCTQKPWNSQINIFTCFNNTKLLNFLHILSMNVHLCWYA